MKPSSRANKKWRKKNPMIHRSFGIKRGRDTKEVEREINDYSKTNIRKDENCQVSQ